jgi:hypothetical protein
LDYFIVVFFDNILVFLKILKEHRKQVRIVVELLAKVDLYVRLNKYMFEQEEVEFLEFLILEKGICIDSARIATI